VDAPRSAVFVDERRGLSEEHARAAGEKVREMRTRHQQQRIQGKERLLDVVQIEKEQLLEAERLELEKQEKLKVVQDRERARLVEEAAKKDASRKSAAAAAAAAQHRAMLEQHRRLEAEEKQKQKVDEAKKADAAKAKIANAEDEYLFGSTSARAEAKRVEDLVGEVEQRAKKFETDASQSSARMQIKKSVNRAINQISASEKQVMNKMGELHQTIQRAEVTGTHALAFCEHIIAERLVAEGAGQVMLHPRSSFPIAMVTAALMAVYPTIRDLVVAHFHRASVMTVPMHARRTTGMSDEEYSEKMGRKRGESVEIYQKRMCGYVSLYAALVQTELPESLGIGANPYGIEHGWRWLARVANMKPRNLTCMAIDAFLDIAAFSLSSRYGRQFHKLMQALLDNVLPTVPSKAPPGPTSRLETFLKEILEKRAVDAPKGKFMPYADSENVA